ncbi:MAG: hypothetical protein AAF081_07355 [Actinomycetota bacterium]
MPDTQTLSYPHDFRTPHRFVLDVPGDWVILESPGTLFAAAAPADHAGPWINVTVAHERIAAGQQETTFVRESARRREADNGIEITGEAGFEGPKGDSRYLRVSEYADPATGERCSRLDVSIVAPNPIGFLVDDMFVLSFITPAGDDLAPAETSMEILASFQFV